MSVVVQQSPGVHLGLAAVSIVLVARVVATDLVNLVPTGPASQPVGGVVVPVSDQRQRELLHRVPQQLRVVLVVLEVEVATHVALHALDRDRVVGVLDELDATDSPESLLVGVGVHQLSHLVAFGLVRVDQQLDLVVGSSQPHFVLLRQGLDVLGEPSFLDLSGSVALSVLFDRDRALVGHVVLGRLVQDVRCSRESDPAVAVELVLVLIFSVHFVVSHLRHVGGAVSVRLVLEPVGELRRVVEVGGQQAVRYVVDGPLVESPRAEALRVADRVLHGVVSALAAQAVFVQLLPLGGGQNIEHGVHSVSLSWLPSSESATGSEPNTKIAFDPDSKGISCSENIPRNCKRAGQRPTTLQTPE